MKIVLNDEQIAAISAGATLDTLGFTADQIAAHQAAEAAEKLAADNDAAAKETERLAAEAAVTAAAALAAANKAQAPPADTGVVDLLKSQLSTASATILAKEVELVNLRASTQSITASHEGLLAIARAATGKMAVALGASAGAADNMDAAAVIAEHTRLSADFAAKFKPGQQSAAKPADKLPAVSAAPAGFLAALNRKTA